MPASEPSELRAAGLPTIIVLALLHGVLYAAGFEPFTVWPATLLALVPLTWLALRARCGWKAMAIVLAVQFPAWLLLNRWMAQVTGMGYFALQFYLALFPVAFVWIVRRLGRHPRTMRLPMTLIVPVVWTTIDCMRGEVLLGAYPWFLLGHPLIDCLPLVQSADLFGTYFVGFLAALPAGLLVDLMRARHDATPRRRVLTLAAVVLVAWIANVVYGMLRLGQETPLRPGPTVLAIQTNLPQDNKIGWSVEQQAIDVPAFIQQTHDALDDATAAVDVIVWPETMVPGVGLEPDTIKTLQRFGAQSAPWFKWGLAVVEMQKQIGIPMIVGSPAWVGTELIEDDGGYRAEPAFEYNSAYLVLGNPPYQRYDKIHLTPFGETMPYISRWKWLEERLMGLAAPGMSFRLSSNPDIRILTLPGDDGLRMATPICYEDTMGRVCRRMVYGGGDGKRVDVLINLSNDGWFGANDAVRRQHNRIARFRCIENRVPMMRAANTGQSVAVDSRGKVIGTVGDGRYGVARQAGSLLAELRLDSRDTLYRVAGDGWAWACLAGTVVLIGVTFTRTRHGPAS